MVIGRKGEEIEKIRKEFIKQLPIVLEFLNGREELGFISQILDPKMLIYEKQEENRMD